MSKLHPSLSKLPEHMLDLELTSEGYPVLWFISEDGGTPGARKWMSTIRLKLCATCGNTITGPIAFGINPKCTITRLTREPPTHPECAKWVIHNCPALTSREQSMGGVIALWITDSYLLFKDDQGQPLIHLGNMLDLSWWLEGRTATCEEATMAIESHLPELWKLANDEGPEAAEDLGERIKASISTLTVVDRAQ